MDNIRSVIVSSEDHGCRIDKFLAIHIDSFSRSQWKACINTGDVYVNSKCANPDYRVNANDVIYIYSLPPSPSSVIIPQNIDLNIVHESDSYLVVDKQSGITVHPGSGCVDGTLINGLLFRYPELRELPRAGLLHRLDKNTSGLLIVAKNQHAYQHLFKQMMERKIEKRYWALVWGETVSHFTIEKNVGRDCFNRTKMAICNKDSGRYAKTICIPHKISPCRKVSLVECILETGRTHQIRVHLSSCNLPIIGDEKYSPGNLFLISPVKRQCLHAKSIKFICPERKCQVSYYSKIPTDIESAIKHFSIDQ
ncbi:MULTISPECIES: RluA family pseudouridine synthase [Candidatus Ichthyocystis]|uniref:Pseudouridine synthase n=1 Tax=Candidatus Ichthyocystis hellenicum TaxID=1561003 RepID=A0A0S4M5H9_9BURK|nr:MULTISPECIES: RluA family pseudouridine synthase [Ichthyocystis]CUT17978.1 23S rRNA pseudouridine synthase [Candidatus Ichthyocystis hellenicum]